jgi:DNA (cytosine-5)-methyltransferase 1
MKIYLDLFSGIGGFALGAYWAGMKFHGHYFSEVDDYAIGIYKKRLPDAIPLGDVRNIRGEELPNGCWIITGGFPCQDISVAGKGAGLDGRRSGLWFEYARLIGEIRPRFAIVENVGALVVRGLDRVLGSLAEIGYDAIWQDIRASDVGAPHRRERIWIIAYPRDWNPNSSHVAKEQEICGGENTESRRICGDVANPGWGGETMADTNGEGLQGRVGKSLSECSGKRAVRESGTPMADAQSGKSGKPPQWKGREDFSRGSKEVSDTDSPGLQTPGAEQPATGISGCGEVSDTGSTRIVKRKRQCWNYQQSARTGKDNGGRAQIDEIRKWWAAEPDVCCVADGLPPGLGRYEGRLANKSYKRRDQLKGYGNAIVPQIAMMLWQHIKEYEERENNF